jgi:hypothetical protein
MLYSVLAHATTARCACVGDWAARLLCSVLLDMFCCRGRSYVLLLNLVLLVAINWIDVQLILIEFYCYYLLIANLTFVVLLIICRWKEAKVTSTY